MEMKLFLRFQDQVVRNVQNGYIGNDPGVRVWTFSSSLMFSLTIFTTIGMYFPHSSLLHAHENVMETSRRKPHLERP